MLNAVIRAALQNRLVVLALAAFVAVYGGLVTRTLPVDVFPDLNRPVVTLMTEAEGYAPEEVETLVIRPLENAMQGAAGVSRVRSASSVGLGIVWVEFDWDTAMWTARQTVTERLQSVQESLPEGVRPTMSPVSSIMGEIMLLGLTAPEGKTSPRELRSLAEWTIRPRLLSTAGVSQVTVMGGGLRQVQVVVDLAKLKGLNLSSQQVAEAVRAANQTASGRFLEVRGKEKLVRFLGRVRDVRELEAAVVTKAGGRPVTLGQVADIIEGDAPKRGDAGVNGKPAVILSIQKQPGADTIALTARIHELLNGPLKKSMPLDVKTTVLFKQATFIENAIHNVVEALRDGSILVAVVLVLFLMNFRTTAITLTAIPLSFFTALLVFKVFGMGINTMTLGGLAVAIGELVDDAIVDVENVFRRLRENALLPSPRPVARVVFEASSEVRNSIVYATLIVGLVFLPLFFLSGVEGRMFIPLGVSYLVALTASLVVSLTVTPVLCASFLGKFVERKRHGDGLLVRSLKRINLVFIRLALGHPYKVVGLAGLMFALTAAALPVLPKEFLPAFNEGTLTVSIQAPPGISLPASVHLGTMAENLIRKVPEAVHTGRRTGRAENDEHAEDVNFNEIDVDLKPSTRSREEILEDIRERLSVLPGVSVNVGQPIGHRLDHLLSGVRAQIAVKIYGEDLAALRKKAQEVRGVMAGVPGVTDLAVEKQVLTPQIRIAPDREAAAQYGVPVADIAEAVQSLVGGEKVGDLLEGRRVTDLVLRAGGELRREPASLGQALVALPDGGLVPLREITRVIEGKGPNQVLHENGLRRIVVMANVQGRDLGGVVNEIQQRVDSEVNLRGFQVEYGGQFESQQNASRIIGVLAVASVLGIFLLLLKHFGMARLALQVMVNIPLALTGGMVAVVLARLPLSVAAMVGFITLCGIASRNGIMMVSHYLHLVRHEGESFSDAMIIRGTQERLVPVLMTALTAVFALIPLAMGAGQPGRELLHPIAVVILGGLLTSTFMDQMVTPALFKLFGEKAVTAPVSDT